MKRTVPVNERPLVVRCGAMGDMVLLVPMIRALSRRFGAPIDLVTTVSWPAPMLAGQPGVGDLLRIGSRRRPYVLSPDQWRLVARLRKRRPGPVWLCDELENTHALLMRAGIAAQYIVAAREHPFGDGEHVVDRWLRMARVLPPALCLPRDQPTPTDPAVPVLEVAQEWRNATDEWLERLGLRERRLVLVQAGNKRTMRRWRSRRRTSNVKYWPEERWAAVVDGVLARDPSVAVLLLGVDAERPVNDDIARGKFSGRALNVAGDVPIPRLLALQERAAGMISVDTGPAHSAAAVDCPLVVLFSTADPREIGPRSRSSPVEILGGRCESLLAITEGDVLGAWDRVRAWR